MIIYSDDNLEFKASDLYYTITVGNKTWYWNKEDGKFDGTSIDLSNRIPVLLPIS